MLIIKHNGIVAQLWYEKSVKIIWKFEGNNIDLQDTNTPN